VIVKQWSQDMLDTFQSTWMEVVAEQSAESEGFKAVWDDLSAFRADYDFWQENAFLPRTQK